MNKAPIVGDVTGLGTIGAFCSWDGAIYHSSDGTNWTRVYTPSRTIKSIVVHPVTPTIVLAADRKYVHKSADGGLTWTPGATIRLPKLAFNPLDADIVYAVGGDPKISTDGGDTWDYFSYGLPAGGSIRAIAVDRAPGIQTIYIGYAGVWSYSQLSPQPAPPQGLYLPIIMKNY